jgi:cytosine/adenosine deaminase-related metal-dependent hydrolase
MLVHNTFSEEEDIDTAEKLHSGLSWCLCPNANLYIENRLPDIKLMMKKGISICVGTDSLASNRALSITDELNVLFELVPNLKLETALKWATFNGAKALGIENKYGSLQSGTRPGLNLLRYENNKLQFLQKLS